MQPSTTLCPPHLSPLYEPRWKENRDSPPLPRPINSFITALLLRKSPPRIITSPVISPLFSYARDNGYVANHSCTSIDLAHRFFVPFHRLFSPLPLFRSSKLSIRATLFSRDSNFSRNDFPSRSIFSWDLIYSSSGWYNGIIRNRLRRNTIESIRRCNRKVERLGDWSIIGADRGRVST